MSARAVAIHGYEMSGERRANLEIKSECPALLNIDCCSVNSALRWNLWSVYLKMTISQHSHLENGKIEKRESNGHVVETGG